MSTSPVAVLMTCGKNAPSTSKKSPLLRLYDTWAPASTFLAGSTNTEPPPAGSNSGMSSKTPMKGEISHPFGIHLSESCAVREFSGIRRADARVKADNVRITGYSSIWNGRSYYRSVGCNRQI